MKYMSSDKKVFRSGKYNVMDAIEEDWEYNEENKLHEKIITHQTDPEKYIKYMYFEYYRPNDFDTCGDEEIVFKFDNDEYWLLDHRWWATWEEDEDFETHWTPHHEYEITKLEEDDKIIPEGMKIKLSRDWLVF